MNKHGTLLAVCALAAIVSVLGASVAAAGSGSGAATRQDTACPHDLTYWRQNPGAWPVATLTLGSNVYDQATLLTLLFTTVNGDASVALAQELAGTKLNAALNLDAAAAADAVAGADAALSAYEGWLPFGIAFASEAGQSMLSMKDVLSLFNSGFFTPDCETTSPSLQTIVLNGFVVSYVGRTYDVGSDTTTFTYVVSGTGVPPDLSYFTIGLPFCVPTLVLVAYTPTEAVSFGADPNTGVSGIKWDLPLKVNETRTYTLTFQGEVVEGTVEIAVKGGSGFEIGSLPGPSCAAPSIDVEKLVSVDGGATWVDADHAPGPALAPGSAVQFKIVVTNDGNVTLTGIDVADDTYDLSACALLDPLEPGASFECAAGPVAAAEGQQVNTAVVSAAFAGQTYTDSDPAHYFGGTPTSTPTPTATPTPTPTRTPTVAPPPPVGGGACPLSQGFWKNHPASWPVDTLVLGGQAYSKAELLTILHTTTQGDASLILAYQLIAAKLNIAAGADPTPVEAVIAQADGLLGGYGGKLPYGVAPSSSVGQEMVAAAGTLDRYNNGHLTPNCGEAPVVIEGPVTRIEGNIIVINNISIWLDPDDPLLTVIRVGDVFRCEGRFERRGTMLVLVIVNIVFVFNEAIVEIEAQGPPAVIVTGGGGLPPGCKYTGFGNNNIRIKCDDHGMGMGD